MLLVTEVLGFRSSSEIHAVSKTSKPWPGILAIDRQRSKKLKKHIFSFSPKTCIWQFAVGNFPQTCTETACLSKSFQRWSRQSLCNTFHPQRPSFDQPVNFKTQKPTPFQNSFSAILAHPVEQQFSPEVTSNFRRLLRYKNSYECSRVFAPSPVIRTHSQNV